VALSERSVTLLREASAEILEAQKPLRVLRVLSWSEEVERGFFAAGARELPSPTYRVPPEVAVSLERLRALQARLGGDGEIERFLRETVTSLATAARMLMAIGSKDFYFHAVELYGRPGSLSSDRRTTNLGLARHFDQVVTGFSPPPEELDRPSITAEEAVPLLKARFEAFFPDQQIGVVVVDGMVASASASADEIKLKRGARFSPRDLRQIEFHEGQVHVATARNGRAQPVMSFLGSPMPRTTSTQEGLAVLTEFLTRSTSLPRIRRISDRVLAIQRAEDGADFLQVFRFFLERGYDEAGAFDGARRVFRGGLLGGGAPVHQGRLLPRRALAGDQLPAHRPDPRPEPPRPLAVRRQAGGGGRAALRPPHARGAGGGASLRRRLGHGSVLPDGVHELRRVPGRERSLGRAAALRGRRRPG
jgi:uncharacterized protein (TIGR02421 family)